MCGSCIMHEELFNKVYIKIRSYFQYMSFKFVFLTYSLKSLNFDIIFILFLTTIYVIVHSNVLLHWNVF